MFPTEIDNLIRNFAEPSAKELCKVAIIQNWLYIRYIEEALDAAQYDADKLTSVKRYKGFFGDLKQVKRKLALTGEIAHCFKWGTYCDYPEVPAMYRLHCRHHRFKYNLSWRWYKENAGSLDNLWLYW